VVRFAKGDPTPRRCASWSHDNTPEARMDRAHQSLVSSLRTGSRLMVVGWAFAARGGEALTELAPPAGALRAPRRGRVGRAKGSSVRRSTAPPKERCRQMPARVVQPS